MKGRRPPTKRDERDVLVASRRRCCLCFFLDSRDEVRRGQIAHLNRNPQDSRFDNLVFLCLAHHDEYDTRTSQSKALLVEEVREYRNRLYAINPNFKPIAQKLPQGWSGEGSADDDDSSDYKEVRRKFPTEYDFTTKPWRYPLWQVANEPEFFAFKAGNRMDGVCLIERINIPDGRIVIACIQMSGNPGNSITNCVEELCFQVAERFNLPASRLVWLEHYDDYLDQEWRQVTFEQTPPRGPFLNPKWQIMTPEIWKEMRLRPKKRLKRTLLGFESKIQKLFPWSVQNLYAED